MTLSVTLMEAYIISSKSFKVVVSKKIFFTIHTFFMEYKIAHVLFRKFGNYFTKEYKRTFIIPNSEIINIKALVYFSNLFSMHTKQNHQIIYMPTLIRFPKCIIC